MITNFPIKVIAPIAINNQANFFELAKPGLLVVLRKIPKNKITNASEIPNITLFFFVINNIYHTNHHFYIITTDFIYLQNKFLRFIFIYTICYYLTLYFYIGLQNKK